MGSLAALGGGTTTTLCVMTDVLPDPEIFIGLSALGLTVTGFSGLISVVGRRASGNWSHAERFQLEQLLELSLAVTFASFIPILVSTAADQESSLSIATALVAIFHLLIMARGFYKTLTRGASALELPTGVVPFTFLGGVILIASALAASFGYIGGHAILLVSNILWLLMIALIHFVGLLMNPGSAEDA
jgi:hypothetical protein